MIAGVRGRASVFAAALLAPIACGGCGPKQVCECAVLAGGMPPASEDDAAYRSSEVQRCLARHGGGTTTGCPQPAGMPRAVAAAQAPVMVPVSLGRVRGYIATAAAFDNDARHWTPTLQDVGVFEGGLVDYLRTARPPEEPDLYRIVPDYKRQYEGLILDGRRVLFVFFRCPRHPDDDSAWSEHPMMVSDGGKCYFDIRFDIVTREYSQLMFNGEA
jgi:hypothetical protein